MTCHRRRLLTRELVAQPLSHMIWVPAFAGMSGFWFSLNTTKPGDQLAGFRYFSNQPIVRSSESTTFSSLAKPWPSLG